MLKSSRVLIGQKPFDLLSFLEGQSVATGIFEDRFSRERRRFTVDLDGRKAGDALELHEHFSYDDGSSERRVWRLDRQGETGFTGLCPDSIGPAAGRLEADRATMDYDILLALGGSKRAVRYSDVFIPIDEATVLNRATVSKWGIRLGQALIVFRKG